MPLTAEGAIIGTLQYMAPEQLEGRETDARTDVFAWVREAKPAALEGPEPGSRRSLFAVALVTLAVGALITAFAMGISSSAPADEVTR